MYKKSARLKGSITVVLLLAAILTVVLLIKGIFFSQGKQAKGVVDEFYHYEQAGDYPNSWTLFHSSMKEKFSKSSYIQARPHVFINDFGVETFTYTLGKPEKLGHWKMSKTGPTIKDVYKFPVTQTFKGKFGNFELTQAVFVAKEKEQWKILWDYNQ